MLSTCSEMLTFGTYWTTQYSTGNLGNEYVLIMPPALCQATTLLCVWLVITLMHLHVSVLATTLVKSLKILELKQHRHFRTGVCAVFLIGFFVTFTHALHHLWFAQNVPCVHSAHVETCSRGASVHIFGFQLATHCRKPTLKSGKMLMMVSYVTLVRISFKQFPALPVPWGNEGQRTAIVTSSTRNLCTPHQHRVPHGKQLENPTRQLGSSLESTVLQP